MKQISQTRHSAFRATSRLGMTGLFLIILISAITRPATAATIYVNAAATGANNGTSWTDAFKTISSAITAAIAEDQIWVAQGVYVENLYVAKNIALYGGFAGNETELSQRNWITNLTILDGNQAKPVIYVYGSTADTRIDGFTIRNGRSLMNSNGNGIVCRGFTTIANNRIYGNFGDNSYDIDCAIDCLDSPTIINNTISGNSAGIHCTSSATVVNNTIVGNNGYGIIADSSNARLYNNIVAFNTYGIRIYYDTRNVRTNCVYGNRILNYMGLTPPGTNNNISVNPMLANVVYGNTHIQLDSPCVDAGDDTVILNDWQDIDAQPRIQGNHVDIGADESDGSIWSQVPPIIIRVAPEGNDANDGSKWSTAKRTVQSAINAAFSCGGDVWVKLGTYSERINMKTHVHVYGGFAGTETQRDQRNWRSNVSTLDGQAGGSVVTFQTPGWRDSTIDGFTIRNGTGTSPYSDSYVYGGGIYCYYTYGVISNNRIVGNTVSASVQSYGGGIYCADATSPLIVNNIIAGNTATNGIGGGISCMGCTGPLVINNVILGNSAKDYGGMGRNGYPMIYNSIIAFNSSGSAYSGSMQGYNCVFGNTAYNYKGTDPTGTNGNISADPRFMKYFGAGPDGKWGTADDIGDLRLRVDSPCIDAGINTEVPPEISTDYFGRPRFVDALYKTDTGSGTSPIVDIGAYEAGPELIPLYVKADATGANTGRNWTDAYTQLYDALSFAAATPETTSIWVAAGVYKPAIAGGSRSATFQHKIDLAIYGGFAGNEDPATFNLADRNFTANPTILSGDLNGNDGPNFSNNAENSYHVVTVSGLDDTAILDGFTIQGGNANGAAPHDRGAGIYNDNGKPKLSNCILTGNAASTAGAALSNNGSLHMSLDNCQFIANASGKYGGAITNTAGFYTDAVDCTFIGNTAPTYGGAISNFIPRATSGNATLRNCVFHGNKSISGSGGAIYGNLDLMNNCVFSGNSAAYGGVFAGVANMIHCTLSRNTASTSGGGIYYTSSAPKLSNCILWNNSDNSGMTKNAQIYGDKPNINYSVVQNWTVGVTGRGNTSTDPLFVDADGPDNIIGTADDDLHLQAGSPCIDTGAALARAYYQTGTTRSDNTLDTGIVDMGFHYDATLAFDADGDLDSADFVAFSACYDGPVNFVEPDCYQADFNNDHYVDAVDFDFFSACYNGPTNLPGCR